MDILIIFCGVMMGIVCFSRAMTKRAKAQRLNKLLEENPTAWKVYQEVEREKAERNRAGIGKAVLGIAPDHSSRNKRRRLSRRGFAPAFILNRKGS